MSRWRIRRRLNRQTSATRWDGLINWRGTQAHAAPLFRKIYVTQPLTYEAAQAAAQLQAMGTPLSAAERKTHADVLFNAKRYSEASAEYSAIGKNNPQLSTADRNALTIYAAVCDFKLKHLDRHDVEKLPDTGDDTAALKLYMLAELSRSEDDRAGHDALITQMIQRYPTSRWLEEALYSGGNMYLLKHDAGQAIYHYTKLVELFPNSTYAPSSHWRAAWMDYRTRNYPEAARLMDEQIVRYAGGSEIPDALYWRGRIYEDEEHNFAQAANYYRRLTEIYPEYYYAGLARQRLAALGKQPAAPPAPALSAAQKGPNPNLTGDLPENDIHLIKARLLANAALNEYIGPEIRASPNSDEWGALAQAEIYVSYGEYTRALQSMKHSGISFYTLPDGPGARGLLASPVSPALLEGVGGRCWKQWARPVSGGVADSAGVGVQRRSGEPQECVRPDATAAIGRESRWRKRVE